MTSGQPPGPAGEDVTDVGEAGQVDGEVFMRLSAALRDAFAEVTASRLSADEAARWQRRLIAVTNVAKRDLAGALQMMERFERDWRKRRR